MRAVVDGELSQGHHPARPPINVVTSHPANEPIDVRRRMVALDHRCGRQVQGVHCGALRLVARPLPVRDYHFHRLPGPQREPRRGTGAGSGWPARHYIHKTALAGLYAHMIGSTEPDSQRQRTNWHHGSPDGKESIGRCRLLQVAAPLVAKSISSVPKSINNSCSSHLDGPGEP